MVGSRSYQREGPDELLVEAVHLGLMERGFQDQVAFRFSFEVLEADTHEVLDHPVRMTCVAGERVRLRLLARLVVEDGSD